MNHDFPMTTEDYVHRIGRTGRAQRNGTAYTFFTINEARLAKQLINVLIDANQQVPPQLEHMANSFYGKGSGRNNRFLNNNFKRGGRYSSNGRGGSRNGTWNNQNFNRGSSNYQTGGPSNFSSNRKGNTRWGSDHVILFFVLFFN